MKDGKFGFELSHGLTYGSGANFDGKEVGYTAMPIPPMPRKKFGQNSGWPAATGYTEEPGELDKSGES
jgi:hypothetical protein